MWLWAGLHWDHTPCSILSVRELRTLLTVINGLPITMDDVHTLEDILKTCDEAYMWTHPQVSDMEYHTLYDPKLVRWLMFLHPPPPPSSPSLPQTLLLSPHAAPGNPELHRGV